MEYYIRLGSMFSFTKFFQIPAIEAVDDGKHIFREVAYCFFNHPVGYAIVGGSDTSRHTGNCVAVATQRDCQADCRLVVGALQEGNNRLGARALTSFVKLICGAYIIASALQS